MKKNIIIILSLLLICMVSPLQMLGQSKKNTKAVKAPITAQVVDVNGNFIQGVKVFANEGADETVTNAYGEFTIDLKEGTMLMFEAEGYEKAALNRASIVNNFNKVALKNAADLRTDAKVNVAFQSIKKSRTTGNITVIDANKAIENDARLGISAQLYGKTTGSLGSFNFHGLGNAVTVVDGVVRDANYLNMQEIEQITVLKDAYSRMLYGADGDAAVILVTTKSGAKFKKVINLNFEHGVQTTISKPKFLDAANYMKTYNKAYKNDGLGNEFYKSGAIDSTAKGLDPILYPNNNYWGDQFVKNMTNFSNLYAEASGGNDKVQYFMNLGWKRNAGWLALADNDVSDLFNLRGKVDFEVTDWLKMKADIVALFDIYRGPETRTFFMDASKLLPNSFPLLIPYDRVANLDSLAGKNPVGNSLLGGTSVYQQNLYGDLTRGGNRMDLNRFVQYMMGFDIDLKKLTKGLTLSGMVDVDFFNYYSQFTDNKYAVYNKTAMNSEGKFDLTKIGQDKITNAQTVNDANSSFSRTYNGYLTANYNRIFGKHHFSAVALGYYNQMIFNKVNQDAKRLRFGAQANYTYDEKYIVEAGLLYEGSNKMHPDNRFKATPSFGAGWILSNEDFLSDNTVVDYLKLRGTYGLLVNDNWFLGNYGGYFLYEPNYQNSTTFNYNNTAVSNNSVNIISLGNKYNYQTRKEFVAGFDAYLLDKKLWVEASYWNSLSSGNLTYLWNSSPATLGVTPIGNYNDTRYEGIEVGLNYNERFGDFNMNLGVNYLYSKSNITKLEEPVYPANNAHLSRVNTSASSLWGLTHVGLYSADDFNPDGTLVDGLPKPSFGVVRPGDIKYKDINGDNIINADDQTVLGLGGNNQQISFNIDLNYKKWQLFVLGVGTMGGQGFKNSSYYWFRGNQAKYSEVALKAYDPENPNPNAEYPRLTLGNGNNNYVNSTFWMFDRSNFSLAALQLAYNFDFKASAPIKTLKVYARGSNLVSVGKNLDIIQLNWNSTPQSRVFSMGLIANF
jgi:TonB-linked SusC/RagA family outer membrane protein